MKHEPFSYGTDLRGDYAYFLPLSYVQSDGWGLCPGAATGTSEPIFFRGLDVNGEETGSHGWIEDDKIVQWG